MRKAGADAGSARQHDDILDVMDAMELAAMVWNETFERINHFVDITDQATQLALTEARQEAKAAAKALEDTQNRATTLPDGRRIYRDQNGNVYTEDGARLSPAEYSNIEWKENSSSWEEFESRKRRNQQAQQSVSEIERYQQRVQEARERLNNAKPGTLSQEDLEKIEEDLQQGVPGAVRHKRDKMLADEPEPPSHAARQARMDMDVSASDRNTLQAINTPKLSILTPA